MTDKNTMNKQERTNREIGLESIMESMYNEDCGTVHASVKRKKKKVKEADDPNVKQRTSTLFKKADAKSPPPNDTVKCDKCNGDGCDHCNGTGEHVVKEAASDLRAEVDEYLTTAVHTTGAEDLKANVLEIIDRHLGGGGPATAPPAPSPTGPISSPARQSQSPLRPSGMSGLGM